MDYYWSADRCKLQKKLDQRCVSSYECIKPLECRDSKCQCPNKKYWNGSQCRPKKQLNSICKTSQECSVTLFCIHGVCKCDRIDYWTGHNCSTRKQVHSTCKINDECKDLLHCVNGSCSCLDTVNRFWNGIDCIPKKAHGESCSSSEECSGLLVCYSTEPHDWNETVCLPAPKECADISFVQSGVFTIAPIDTQHPMLAFCVIEAGQKWTVIQRRVNGSVDFYRSWQEYKEGFGNVLGELWLGNDAIHSISSNGRHKLRVDLEVISGGKYYAEYSNFRLEDENSNYLLHVTGYSGTAGDSMVNVSRGGVVNGATFSTKDRHNSAGDCSDQYRGGWWYKTCEYSDLNGSNTINGNTHIMDWRYNLGVNVLKSMMMIAKY